MLILVISCQDIFLNIFNNVPFHFALLLTQTKTHSFHIRILLEIFVSVRTKCCVGVEKLHLLYFSSPSLRLCIQTQRWKQHQDNAWNLFEVSNKDTKDGRTTSLISFVSLLLSLKKFHTLFWCFYCWLWTSKGK